jgi:hypothetical protein
VTAATCPGTDTTCSVRTCINNTCGFHASDAGILSSGQTPGDCLQLRCDGDGGVSDAVDDSDLPADDGLQCTVQGCNNGAPFNAPSSTGTSCNEDGGSFCDGTGFCVQCNAPTDCGPTGNQCTARTCSSGVCGTSNNTIGTFCNQDAGSVCNGSGDCVQCNLANDCALTGNQCTAPSCTSGVCGSNPLSTGTACNTNNGTFCDGTGLCVQCISPTDCPATGSECIARTCNQGLCGTNNLPTGTVTPTQVAHDCKQRECDGAGGYQQSFDDIDLPLDDGNACTTEACSAGNPTSTPTFAGTSCDGGVCDGTGVCVQCNFASDCGSDTQCETFSCGGSVCSRTWVDAGTACTDNGGTNCSGEGQCIVRQLAVLVVGDGNPLVSGAAEPLTIEYRSVADGSLIRSVALPSTGTGAQASCTISSNSTLEGDLALSGDRHFLSLACYGADAGTASVSSTTSATVNRIVGRVNAAGAVDTSTRIGTAFSTNSIRSACTNDGTGFWAVGANSGVQYVRFGSDGGSTTIATAPDNARRMRVFSGQLYGAAGAGGFNGVFTVDGGLPTDAGQVANLLPGMPTSTTSPASFLVFDRSPSVPGPDLIYFAESSSSTTLRGIQKWTSNGLSWTLAATFNSGLTNGVAGLTGYRDGNSVILFATTLESTTRLLKFVDDGVSTTPTPTVVYTAPTNYVLRGVALVPQ